MKHTISVLVKNEPGILSCVCDLFSTRGYNIESLSVAPTIDPSFSRITIVTVGDEFVIEKLKTVDKPVVLVLNKIDKISREEIMNKIIEYKDLYDFKEIVPVSALKKDNVKELIKTIKGYLPDEFQYYGKDDITNKSLEFLMAEIVREKVFELTEEEVPHSLTCITTAVEVGKTSYTIYVDIIIDRDSLKKIIIGARGAKIKEIGIRARKDLENLLDKSVYLDLNVKTVKNWRDKDKYLQEYGFKDFES